MKTKKQLLEAFLKKLGLWEVFEQEMESHQNIPSWENFDDNLDIVQTFDTTDVDTDKRLRVAIHLADEAYISSLLYNDHVGEWMFNFALIDLFRFAGLESRKSQLACDIPDHISIIEIINRVYDAARKNEL